MKDNELAQVRDELARFRGTVLYATLKEGLKNRRLSVWRKLLRLGVESSDAAVRGVSEAILTEASFERELRHIESTDTILQEQEEPEIQKEYGDYNEILGLGVEREVEWK